MTPNEENLIRSLIPLYCDFCKTGIVVTSTFGAFKLLHAQRNCEPEQAHNSINWSHRYEGAPNGRECPASALHELLNVCDLKPFERTTN